MEEIFKEISEEEKCNFTVTRENEYAHTLFASFIGLRISSLILNIEYKGHNIQVVNKVGDHKMGEIKCELLSSLILSNFDIKYKSHYWRLFNRKSNILTIKSDNQKLNQYLQDKLISSRLENISRKSQFEPTITGFRNDKHYNISTSYSLQFHHKREVLKPLISFYKSIIDYAIFVKNNNN